MVKGPKGGAHGLRHVAVTGRASWSALLIKVPFTVSSESKADATLVRSTPP